MPFTTPTFNLPANIFRNWNYNATGLNPTVINATAFCNLQLGRKVQSYTGGFHYALFPLLTDVRSWEFYPDGHGDVVEIPAGSGRFYVVTWVDDAAKGFTNEHRVAIVVHPKLWFIVDNVPLAPTPYP